MKRVADIRALAMSDDSAAGTVVLRPAGLGDRGFLADLYAGVRAAEMAPVPWPEQAKREFLQHQFELQDSYYRLNYPGADFWVIERNGAPIGRIYIYRTPRDIRLMDVSLLPEARGQGIGSALLGELIEESDRTGATITLHVEAENPVMRLYHRLGFQHLEDRGVYQFLGRSPRSQLTTASNTMSSPSF